MVLCAVRHMGRDRVDLCDGHPNLACKTQRGYALLHILET